VIIAITLALIPLVLVSLIYVALFTLATSEGCDPYAAAGGHHHRNADDLQPRCGRD
jgi:hypothetical protein